MFLFSILFMVIYFISGHSVFVYRFDKRPVHILTVRTKLPEKLDNKIFVLRYR